MSRRENRFIKKDEPLRRICQPTAEERPLGSTIGATVERGGGAGEERRKNMRISSRTVHREGQGGTRRKKAPAAKYKSNQSMA